MTPATVLAQSSAVCMFSSVRMTPRKMANGLYNLFHLKNTYFFADTLAAPLAGHRFQAPPRRFRVSSNKDLVEMLLHLHQIP